MRWFVALWVFVWPADAADEVRFEAADFRCVREGTQVGRAWFTNVAGAFDETVAVAKDPKGKTFPPGTLVVLAPNEAMLKREAGWSPTTNDWEFMKTRVNGPGDTEILARGPDVRNIAGSCAGCHRPAADHDFICASGRGCKPLPGFILKRAEKLVAEDPRCAH